MLIRLGHPLPQLVLWLSSLFTIVCEGALVKCVRSWKLAKTYVDKCNQGANVTIVRTAARNGRDGSGAGVEDSGKVGDGLFGAVVARAVVELVKGGAELLVEGVDGARNVCGTIARDSDGESHSAGSKNAEDGGETHADEVREGWETGGVNERLAVSMRDWRC